MIRGEKTRLRAIEREDIPTFVRWFNDPQVKQYLTIYMPVSQAQEEQWFENQLQDRNRCILAIETLEGVHIGNISLEDIDHKNRNASLGIAIGEKGYWGLGYGSDAIKALLRFAFDEMNLHCVELIVYDFNERAKRAYLKCGFKEEGRLRDRLYRHGAYHDVLMMSVLADEFRQLADKGE